MNKQIRLLIESFFDDEIFNVENDIKSDIEDLGRYYDYRIGDIYYLNDEPYAICCGDNSYFNDNKPRFCLLNELDKRLNWRKTNKLVKELLCFKYSSFILKSIKLFKHIDEDGYRNTLIIKNNYNISEFPAFECCINLGENIYLPAIDELLMLYLNKDKLGKYSFRRGYYWSSTLYSATDAYYIYTYDDCIYSLTKYNNFRVKPFFHIY